MVTRINKMISKVEPLWSFKTNSQNLIFQGMYGDQSGEFICGSGA